MKIIFLFQILVLLLSSSLREWLMKVRFFPLSKNLKNDGRKIQLYSLVFPTNQDSFYFRRDLKANMIADVQSCAIATKMDVRTASSIGLAFLLL